MVKKKKTVRKKPKRIIMNRARFMMIIERINSCPDAVRWLRRTKGTPEQLWNKCRQANWMFFFLIWISGPTAQAVRGHLVLRTGRGVSCARERPNEARCDVIREICPYRKLRPLLAEYFKTRCAWRLRP